MCTNSISIMNDVIKKIAYKTTDINDLLDKVDAVFIVSHPTFHYDQIKLALNKRKHVLCESPSTLTLDQFLYLHNLAIEKGCIFIDAVKTSFSTAYSRLLTLIKTGAIGDIVSVDATCTSLMDFDFDLSEVEEKKWNSICAWGPTALLPVFNILGTNYCSKKIITKILAGTKNFDLFTKIDFIYPNAVASIKVGKGIKSEGELIVSGTKGYIFVPAPWWKTDYFEVRFEDSSKNQRYFYQLEGEGIRYEIVSFIKSVELKRNFIFEDENNSIAKIKVIQDFYDGTDRILL
ncbi:MAG: Gfo/Idh/MocA family oxidoreductase [Treponema sp.]|nr:Gfo/Idh/MocA family oxidoreductase [Treponema sp.]